MRELKESNIEWIGKIPKNWRVFKVKNAFFIRKEKAKLKNPVVLSLARNGINIRDIKNNEGQIAESYFDYNLVKKGDLLLNPMDLYSGANCNVSNVNGVISQAYTKLVGKKQINPYFYDYFFKTQYWSMAFFAHGKGVSFENRWTLNNETLKNYFIPQTSYNEQTKIVNFLDNKVALINSIILKTKESIEYYKQYKQSLITEVVTKGLNPNAEMKESGIEWIGKIPKNWKIYRLKFLLKSNLQYGANEAGTLYNKEFPRYIRITDIDVKTNKLKQINKLSLIPEKATKYMLIENDLLFARSGATVGKTFLYLKEYGKAAFAGYLIKATFNTNICSKFIYYYTLSNSYDAWKNFIFCQSTIQNIGADKYANMELALPLTKNEQVKIVEYLDYKCGKIDCIINKKQTLITELNNYKKSLIYETVTGKKEIN